MAHDRMTLLDLAKANSSDAVAGLIDEAVAANPEFNLGYARSIQGTEYKALVRTALPTVGFRRANEGVETTKSTLVQKLVECFILDASWDIDKAVADANTDGVAVAQALEASAHMQAAVQAICKQLYYGANSGNTGASYGFQGLIDLVDSSMVVDASGTTSATGSSVFGVKFGPQALAWVLGNGGTIDEGEIITTPVTVSSKQMWCYAQSIIGWVGVQNVNKYSVGRIKKLTEDSSCKLTDAFIYQLLEKFPVGQMPDVLLMNRRSLRQLRASRTATNATGAPAPNPVEVEGIPIVVTDSIISTETLTW